MGNGPDGLLVSQARQQPVQCHFKYASFDLYRRLSRLIQKPPHVTIPLRRATLFISSAPSPFCPAPSPMPPRLSWPAPRARLSSFARQPLYRLAHRATGLPYESSLCSSSLGLS